MITPEKVKVYMLYEGDDDMWARAGKKSEKELFELGDWSLIEKFIQQIALVERNLTSEKFAKSLEAELRKECANDEVIEELKKIAKKDL